VSALALQVCGADLIVSLRALNKSAKAKVFAQTRSSNSWRGLFYVQYAR
jgi:hypothetical protein